MISDVVIPSRAHFKGSTVGQSALFKMCRLMFRERKFGYLVRRTDGQVGGRADGRTDGLGDIHNHTGFILLYNFIYLLTKHQQLLIMYFVHI